MLQLARTRARRLVATALGTTVIGALAVAAGPASPAIAAAGSVAIYRVPAATVNYGGSTVVKPKVVTAGTAMATGQTLTIKRGTRTIAYRVKSARLHAGTYAVTTRVTYRLYRVTTSYQQQTQQELSVSAYDSTPVQCAIQSVTADAFTGACTGDFDGPYSISGTLYDLGAGTISAIFDNADLDSQDFSATDPAQLVGTTFSGMLYPDYDLYNTVATSVPVYTRHYGPTHVKTLSQTLIIRSKPKPRGCAYYNDFTTVRYNFSYPELYGDSESVVAQKLQNAGTLSSFDDSGDQVITFRDYKACTPGALISVGFVNGYAYAVHYMS